MHCYKQKGFVANDASDSRDITDHGFGTDFDGEDDVPIWFRNLNSQTLVSPEI